MVVSGCGYHEAHHVNFGAPRGVSGEPEILVDALPDRRFSELGLVEAMGQGTEATRARVLRVLQAEAKAQGCDAVAKVRVTTGQTMTHAIGVCVAWVGP
jgi:uncharacterized protein YbjQ (UPF0145 family)